MAWAWASLLTVTFADIYVRAARARRDRRPGDPLLGATDDPRDGRATEAPGPPARRARRSAPAAPACARRSRRRRPAPTSGSSASRSSARRTRSWPRAASRPRSATSRRRDSWQVHFRDTMVGGKLLNNPRMAELHATEAPDRVRELELWGAVFDRTARRPDPAATVRRPLAPAAGPRRRPDRPGDDPDPPGPGGRARASTVYMECTITRLITGPAGVTGRVRLLAHDRAADRLPGQGRSSSRPAGSARPTRSRRTPGSTAATARRWPTRPAPS